MTKPKNKLYTKSYFIKRLEHAGYKVDALPGVVFRNEERTWMIVVSPCHKNIIIVCYKKSPDDFFFRVIGQSVMNWRTSSMDVIIENLKLLHVDNPVIGAVNG